MYDFEVGEVVALNPKLTYDVVTVGTVANVEEDEDGYGYNVVLAVTDCLNVKQTSENWLDEVKRLYPSKMHDYTIEKKYIRNTNDLYSLGIHEEVKPFANTIKADEVAVGKVYFCYNNMRCGGYDIDMFIVTGMNQNGEVTQYVQGDLYNDDFYNCRNLEKLIKQGVNEWNICNLSGLNCIPLQSRKEFCEMFDKSFIYETICTVDEYKYVAEASGFDLDCNIKLPDRVDRSDFEKTWVFDIKDLKVTLSPRAEFNKKVNEGWYTMEARILVEYDIAYWTGHLESIVDRGIIKGDVRESDAGMRFLGFEGVIDNIIEGSWKSQAVKRDNAGDMSLDSIITTLEVNPMIQRRECTLKGVCKYSTAEELKAALEDYLRDTGITFLEVEMEPWDYRREVLK